jgi:hypothetical protein
MKENTGFKELLFKMMSRRWYITAMVLGFMLIMAGIFVAVLGQSPMCRRVERTIILVIRCFHWIIMVKLLTIGSVIQDKDKMLVQKMDEEDGISLSDTGTGSPKSPIIGEQ